MFAFLSPFKICGDKGIGPGGCAMFAFEIYGGADRRANEYYFQPTGKSPLPGKVAYTNSIYYANAISNMLETTPTILVQVGDGKWFYEGEISRSKQLLHLFVFTCFYVFSVS